MLDATTYSKFEDYGDFVQCFCYIDFRVFVVSMGGVSVQYEKSNFQTYYLGVLTGLLVDVISAGQRYVHAFSNPNPKILF